VKAALAATLAMTAVIYAGCGGSEPLRSENTTSGIRAAEELGAHQSPRASLHLQLAKEELGHAEALAKEGETERAESMLTRAEADAQLAVALSREDAEKSEGLQAVERVRKLRQDHKLSTERNAL